jgi:hypothetical protein
LKKLLTFKYDELRPRPFGILGVIGIFFLVLLLEDILGGVFYATGLQFKGQPVLASVIINLGIWVTKAIVLLVLFRLTMEVGIPDKPSPFKKWIESKDIKKFLWLSIGIVVSMRFAIDSNLSLIIVDKFGMDETLIESMEWIFAAPMLGALYVMIIGPIFEEIVYRGILYGGMRRKGHGVITATIFSSVLFALMHLNINQGVNAFIVGIVFAYVYEKTGNLRASIWLHMLNNIYAMFGSFGSEWLMKKIPSQGRIVFTCIGIVMTVVLLMRYKRKVDKVATELTWEEPVLTQVSL